MRGWMLGMLAVSGAASAAAPPGAVGGPQVAPAAQALPEADAANFRVAGTIVEPRRIRFTPATLGRLTVPPGYRIATFATDLEGARQLAVAEDGTVYLTRRKQGDVVMLRDTDGDGVADLRRIVATRPQLTGIFIEGSRMWLVAQKELLATTILADGGLAPLEMLVGDLPDAGQHGARPVAKGPDGMLYVGVGSTCNACTETSQESATILRLSPDGKQRAIYASGLRHTIGFDWHPRSGQLWGMDNGIDWLGEDQQQEELNRIAFGRNYGWPYIYGDGGQNPQDDPPNGLTMAELDAMATRPVLGYTAHAAPMQLAFYRGGMFPKTVQGDAFVAMRGSWNRQSPSGYNILRVRFDRAGQAQAIEPFVTGFATQAADGSPAHLGRPVGVAVAKDGALLFGDEINGVIYRVTYAGRDRAGSVLPPAKAVAPEMQPRPRGDALATARGETRASARLAVTSPAFADGAPLAPRFSAYHDDLSPPLAWSGAPASARSYALLVEDPDSALAHPVIHWAAWNIPAATTSLPEGVSKTFQLSEPKGMRQGRTTTNRIGYTGPKPPIGDRPHHYHVQLFALDGPLALLPGATREELLAAMAGHVVAEGELVGTYAQAVPPVKK